MLVRSSLSASFIKATQDVRRAEVFEIGDELEFLNHGIIEKEIDDQLLGNGRAIFTLEAE